MLQKRAAWLLVLTIAMLSFVAVSITFARTWKSSCGTYSIDAEFVESKDGTVSLRKPNDNVIRVSVSRLSAEDQAYLAEKASANCASSTMPAVSSPLARKLTFTQLVQSANRLRTAAEVLRLYKMFLQDENVTEADRKAAQKQLPTWEQRANKKMVRIGLRWLTPAEANDQKLQAHQLTAEALRLIEVGQFDAAIDKCLKASKTNEEDILADFLLGLGYALVGCNAEDANRHFAECVRRDPQHISALNNLALSEVRLQKYTQALAHWQTALELAPAAPEVIQNLGRLVYLPKQGSFRVPSGVKRRYSDLYAAAAVSAGAKDFNRRTGWLYMGYYAPLGSQPLDNKKSSSKPSKTSLITIGSGTGFVIHPGYILTNRHVVKDSAGLLIIPPGEDNQKLPATVAGVAEGKDEDLAVIHCAGLKASPLPFIKEDTAPRGTEIMILGFPGMPSGKTPSLKSTRGIISGLPDESFNAYTLDAIANPGNSGGPICDDTGSVLGILYAHTTPLAMNYTLGVPHSRALPLLKKLIPGYEQLPPKTEIKKWSAVDDMVSRSTVLILVQSTSSNCGISASKKRANAKAMEDYWCMTCNGRGTVPCPNRKCKNGTVGAKRQELVFTDPNTGYSHYRTVPFRVQCKTCGGKRVVPCPDCDHGIDRSLR